jgi:hypothetical protein
VNDKLSLRLRQIVALADAGQLPTDLQQLGPSLSLPGSGGGSLSVTADGKLLVNLRLTDASAAAQAELTAHGATIIAVSDPFATVALDPRRLKELTALASVRSVQEALRPATGQR